MYDELIIELKYVYTFFQTLIALILIYSSNSNNNITYRYDLTHTSNNLINLINFNSIQKRFVIFVFHENHVAVLLHSITSS